MTGGTQDGAVGALVPLTEFEARRLTRQITDALRVAWELVAEAYAWRVWEPLGYESWDAYCRGEFASTRLRLPAEEREETVQSLRAAGLSTRAIASATGMSKDTVHRASRGVSDETPAPPGPVTGLDGKQYPTRPAPPAAAAGADEPIDVEIVDETDHQLGDRLADRAPAAAVGGRRRRPLCEQARDAGWELRKAIERIERLTGDDRYPRHAGQMRTLLRGHLIYVSDTAARLLDQMNDQIPEGDTR